MNATKRKFNALLNGIGTRSTTSVSAEDGSGSSYNNKTNASRTSLLSEELTRPRSNNSFAPSVIEDGSSTHNNPSTTADMFTKPALSSATATTTIPSTAPKTAAAELEFLAKRRKIGLGNSPSTSSLRTANVNNAGLTTSASTLRKWTDTKSGSTTQQLSSQTATQTPQPAPRYCPGDREQLLRRLATFQELTDWTPKPDRINEIEWAKRGWVCQGKERVRCTLCSKEIVVRLKGDKALPDAADNNNNNNSNNTTTEAALVAKYAELIVTAHQDDCPWEKMGCDDTLLRLVLANPRYALEGLRERYDELCARKDFLPYEFNLRLPEGLDIDAVLKCLPGDFFGKSGQAASSPPNRVALALAVMGWQGLTNSRIGAVPNSASCHACLRRLGLWMFKSKQVDLETNTVIEPAPMDCLDAVREHRFFCPWKNGAVQRNGSGGGKKGAEENLAGWAVLVQVLKNDDYLRNRMTTGTPRKAAPVTAPATPGRPATPDGRPVTAADTDAGSVFGDGGDDDVEDEATRLAKDKERWARLRRVKSLFDTKGSRRLKKGSESRPGTAKSTKSTKSIKSILGTQSRPQSKGP